MVGGADPTAETEARLSVDLVAAAAQALDVALLDPDNAGDDHTPASLTAGVTPLNSAGSTLTNIDSDLKAMLDEVALAGSSLLTCRWIMRPRTAIFLSLLRGTGGALAYPDIAANGGTLCGLPVLTSGNVSVDDSPAATSIVLVDSDDVTYASGAAAVTLSRQTTLQMRSDPNATGNPATLVSLFQADAAAIDLPMPELEDRVRLVSTRQHKADHVHIH